MIDKAKELVGRRKYHEAIRLLEPTQENDATSEAIKLLVSCYSHTKQHEKAVRICKKQIELTSTQKEKSDWQYRLANIYLEFDASKALETIRDYLGEFKASIHGHALAIRICAKVGMNGEVESYYKAGGEIFKGLNTDQKKRCVGLMAKLHRAYAEYLETMGALDPGKMQEAANIFKLAIEAEPSDGNTWYDLGKIYFNLGNWTESESALQEALKRKQEPYIVRLLAKISSSRGDYKVALNRYREIPAQRAQGYILVEMGQCAEQLNELKEAGRLYKQAVEREPHKHYPHYLLGKLYKRMEAKSQAIEQLKLANELCRKENGVDHKASLELIAECQKMADGNPITFRQTTEVKKLPGKISRYVDDRGFGFIEYQGKQLFFHISNVTDRRQKGDPKTEQTVLFLLIEGRKGPEAAEINRQ